MIAILRPLGRAIPLGVKILCALALAAMLLPAMDASAHRVTVFAWVEGDTVRTTSQFSRNKKVHHGLIEVYDAATGEKFASGRTDDKGEFSFPVPEAARARGSDLRVALQAGQGHAGEWIVPAQEYMAQANAAANTEADGQAAPLTGGSGSEKKPNRLGGQHSFPVHGQGVPGHDTAPSSAHQDSGESMPAHAAQIEQAVERAVQRALAHTLGQELDRRLAPMTRMLAEQAQAGPSLVEIVGGLGWLVGLSGLGAWLAARRKQ